jgi:hypothetical protein
MIVNKAAMEYCLPNAVPLAMLESVRDGEYGPDLTDLYAIFSKPSDVIWGMCRWSKTRQGAAFWREVAAHVSKMEREIL